MNVLRDLHPILKSLIQTIPFFQQAIPTDVSIALANREEIVAYFPGRKIDLKIKQGAPLKPGVPAYEVVQSGQPQISQVPKSLFGIEFTASLLPIKDETHSVIGVLSIGMQRQNEEELRRFSDQIVHHLDVSQERMEQVTNGTDLLAQKANQLLEQSNLAIEQVGKIGEVMVFIKNVTTQTNLLGLNASIEAARAGDAGRGFNVVAQEIRRLADDTKASVEQISGVISSIEKSVNEINVFIEEITSIGHVQASSSNEILDSFNSIQEMAKNLKQYADLI
ncbi:MAG: methyl-accepting chemotaxis protein [Bacillota bacterium]|nr:methyl-accepting chemotaxis protein [Bacillota bacterium]